MLLLFHCKIFVGAQPSTYAIREECPFGKASTVLHAKGRAILSESLSWNQN